MTKTPVDVLEEHIDTLKKLVTEIKFTRRKTRTGYHRFTLMISQTQKTIDEFKYAVEKLKKI